MTVFVYILRCADGSYYVGSTRKPLEERVAEHNSGMLGGYTRSRRPVALVWSQDFERITDAIAMERGVKGWRREKKEALIRGDLGALPGLSTRRQRQSSVRLLHASRRAPRPSSA